MQQKYVSKSLAVSCTCMFIIKFSIRLSFISLICTNIEYNLLIKQIIRILVILKRTSMLPVTYQHLSFFNINNTQGAKLQKFCMCQLNTKLK